MKVIKAKVAAVWPGRVEVKELSLTLPDDSSEQT